MRDDVTSRMLSDLSWERAMDDLRERFDSDAVEQCEVFWRQNKSIVIQDVVNEVDVRSEHPPRHLLHRIGVWLLRMFVCAVPILLFTGKVGFNGAVGLGGILVIALSYYFHWEQERDGFREMEVEAEEAMKHLKEEVGGETWNEFVRVAMAEESR